MPWLMSLPYIVVVDGKAQRQMLSLYYMKVADVITILLFVADGKPYISCMLQHLKMADMLLPSGRWNSHCRVGDW